MIETLQKDTLILENKARLTEETAEIELHTHHLFELASTLLGAAIGLCGLSIILRRKWVWGFGLGMGGLGALLVIIGDTYRISHFF